MGVSHILFAIESPTGGNGNKKGGVNKGRGREMNVKSKTSQQSSRSVFSGELSFGIRARCLQNRMEQFQLIQITMQFHRII